MNIRGIFLSLLAVVPLPAQLLDINVGLPFTSVRVAYRLKNLSQKPIHVDYGFPVDFGGTAKGAYGFDD